MLGSLRRSNTALVGIAVLTVVLAGTALGQANDPAGKEPNAGPASEQSKSQQTPLGAFQKGKKAKPESYRAICDEPGDKDYADLCQQWRQAEAASDQASAARDQVAWARRQFFATIAEIAALVLTLLFTGFAAIAASRAVDAAREQVEIGRLAMTSTERAFVFHDGMRWISHPVGKGKFNWNLRPRWINTGNTPTRNLRVQVDYWLEDQPLPELFSFGILGDRRPAMLPPGRAIEGAHRAVSGEDLLAVKNRKKYLFVWGVATYNDVFENTPEHVTRFCSFVANITGDPLKGWDEKTNPVDLVFVNYHTHHCADEDCESQKFQPPDAKT